MMKKSNNHRQKKKWKDSIKYNSSMARENYAYWIIQDIIDKEIREAFKIREGIIEEQSDNE